MTDANSEITIFGNTLFGTGSVIVKNIGIDQRFSVRISVAKFGILIIILIAVTSQQHKAP